jgi:hypothetical protein
LQASLPAALLVASDELRHEAFGQTYERGERSLSHSALFLAVAFDRMHMRIILRVASGVKGYLFGSP